MDGPFGVEISKAAPKSADAAKKNPEYRKSVLQPLNPRSETYVQRGTGIQRYARPMVGGMVGSVAGGLAGVATRSPAVARAGAGIGTLVGSSMGYTKNLKSGNTVSFNRRSGKKATSKINIGQGGLYNVYN